MTENKTVGMGIIGTGKRGAGLGCHLATLFPETGIEITALCDRNVARMRYAAGQHVKTYATHGVEASPSCYEDTAGLIADPRVDMIMVTSPQHAHREHAVAALRSGKKIYIDKPLAHTTEDAVAIAEAERETGNIALLGFTRRYEDPWRKAYQLLQDGEIDLIGQHGKHREVIDCRTPEFRTSHFGADLRLIRQMRRLYDGKPPTVGVPEGPEATRMVMAALKSMDEGGRTVEMTEIADVSL